MDRFSTHRGTRPALSLGTFFFHKLMIWEAKKNTSFCDCCVCC